MECQQSFRALKFLDDLLQRFPESTLVDEARYVKARIFEETHRLTEAKHLYLEINKTSIDENLRLKTLHN